MRDSGCDLQIVSVQKSTETPFLSWVRSTSNFSASSQDSSISAWLSKMLLFDNEGCL